jgi:anti-anti-sigma factor
MADRMDSFTHAGESGGSGPGAGPTLGVRIVVTGTDLVVLVAGDLDIESSGRFQDAVAETLAAHLGRAVHLDLSGLDFLDVAGARVLATLHDRAVAGGARVTVRGLDERRLPAAAILGLHQYLQAGSAGKDPTG